MLLLHSFLPPAHLPLQPQLLCEALHRVEAARQVPPQPLQHTLPPLQLLPQLPLLPAGVQ
jgi:hypothetical protein